MLKESSKDGNAEGSDLTFPSVIYALLQLEKIEQKAEFKEYFTGSTSVCKWLQSNLVYVKTFRNEDRLGGEEEYYLTAMDSALKFIHDLKDSDLKMPEKSEKLQQVETV